MKETKEVIKEKKEVKEVSVAKEEITGIVHLIGKDIPGNIPLFVALRAVKGIGIRLAAILSKIVAKELNIPEDIPVGRLSEEQVEGVERILRSPVEHGIPSFLLSRRKDIETGKDIHPLGSDLVFTVKQDIDREKDLFSWRGFRHAFGQKVRGQSSRTSGRKGLTVGVTKAKLREAAKAAKAAEEKKK